MYGILYDDQVVTAIILSCTNFRFSLVSLVHIDDADLIFYIKERPF